MTLWMLQLWKGGQCWQSAQGSGQQNEVTVSPSLQVPTVSTKLAPVNLRALTEDMLHIREAASQ